MDAALWHGWDVQSSIIFLAGGRYPGVNGRPALFALLPPGRPAACERDDGPHAAYCPVPAVHRQKH